MPELPDLVHVESKLQKAVRGWQVTAVRIGDPTVLRIMVPDDLGALLTGKTLSAIQRRGHFMVFSFGPTTTIAVNCMLVGRFVLASPADKSPRSLGLALALQPPEVKGSKAGGAAAVELRYVDDKRMGKVYVCPTDRVGEIPQLSTLGVDLLSPAFTLNAFRALARKRRDQVRAFLMDKSALASIGNAYADEILFAARLHPKTFVRKLTPEEIDRLYEQINVVTQRAIAEIAERDEDIGVKVRDFLAVRGRDGKPCPACGTTLRNVRVGDGDAVFCPQCQPATRALFVDWGRIKRGGTSPPTDPPTEGGTAPENVAGPVRRRAPGKRKRGGVSR